MSEKSDLERTQELFDFLQGNVPEGCRIDCGHVPKLTAEQAWTVVWHLGNQYWQVPDDINRCCVCGDLYDSRGDGACLDYGKPPYFFCGACENGEEYEKKLEISHASPETAFD